MARATAWAEQIPKLDAAGVTLTYLSIGDAEKLTKFLSLNPSVPRDRSFVDESRTFDAYQAAGFGKIADTVPEKIDLKPPGFNMSQWFAYLTNVAALVGGRRVCEIHPTPRGVMTRRRRRRLHSFPFQASQPHRCL